MPYSGEGVDRKVGTVVVSYVVDGDKKWITATYNTTIMAETHLYIGTTPYPTEKNGRETVAPGRYGNTDNVFGNEFTYCSFGARLL